MITRIAAAVATTGLILAPQAHADDDWWDRNIVDSPPEWSSIMSTNYLLSSPPGDYPPGVPGMWQVYATPPGPRVAPGPKDFCDLVPYQGAPDRCPAGWDRWYR